MSKKQFIALADAIRRYHALNPVHPFSDAQIGLLCDFCASQNPRFLRGRWLDYIAGKCGPNGGAIKS
jgi:hypothetical protein